MASIARYRSGQTNPKPVLCDPNYPIEVGDLLFREPTNNLARPASALVNQGSETLNQQAFHDQFLGVALQKNGLQSGETVPLHSTLDHMPANCIEIATTGVFEFQLSSAIAYQGGEFIGPANNTGGTGLQNQVVKTAVAGIAGSIGRASPAAAEIGANATEPAPQAYLGQTNVVAVEILSTVFYGGEQAQVAGSSSGAV
jgi:hypothetical protein